MHTRHHGGMRATEVELNHGQTAILDRAANIDPALHRFAAGTTDQMRPLILRILIQVF